MYLDYMGAERFGAAGEVVEAKWNTKNHQMSLFEISAGQFVKKLHHSRVTLTPEQIKIGDRFSKESGSKMCTINNVQLQCVE